jgi:serine/threonine-protein kinase RsbW
MTSSDGAVGGLAVEYPRPGDRTPPSGVLRLQHSPIAVSSARRQVRNDLAVLRVPDPVLDDIEVVVSELLGNSVRHARPIAGGVVLLYWQVGADEVMVRVTDGGGGRGVEPCQPGPMAVSGRGLQIVERLARVWGVSEHAGGLRSVWASIALSGQPRGLRLVT